MLIDSHCHLDKLSLESYDGSLDAALETARSRGVNRFLCIAIDLSSFPGLIDISEQHSDVLLSVGQHPLSDTASDISESEILQYTHHNAVVAIGETGLDYHYAEATAAQQQRHFDVHIDAAISADLPLIVHTRSAKKDTLASLRRYAEATDRGGVLHCFTEDWDMAEQAMAMNFYISISGIVTFRNADSLRELVKRLPLERLLVETDSPYLAPVPYRGKPNEPAYVRDVAEYIAVLRGIDLQSLAKVTSDNFNRLFCPSE